MTLGRRTVSVAIALGSVACAAGTMLAQGPVPGGARANRDQLQKPVFRVAQQPAAQPGAQQPGPAAPAVAANNTNLPQTPPIGGGQAEHPLVPAIQIAYSCLNNIRTNIKDYSCTMVKRERIGNKLNDPEFMHVRVRHEPFSVYMYFLGPASLRGQEALYVAGKNDGNLIGHAGSGIRKIVGKVKLAPTGAMAMQNQRYPITEIGFYNLTKRLIEVAESDKNYGECEVKFYKGAKINKRSCTCIQVVHPVRRANFKFNKALVFVDDELNIPVRYESYDWPETPGGPPVLLEEYTYTDIKINQGFTDKDFDDNNPEYHFN